MKKQSVNFVFSGVTGLALVEGKNVFIQWAGRRFSLATAAQALRTYVIQQLSIAGAL
ncbi:TPA: hypothetical protein NPN74_001611 [Klebsiella quasipneumoniae subsp. quasipneumoniae]|nr:hypothetical protein [Klebsiella quasipneumoniae subsp. quasipneumoniae]